jgi:hypothetical protein
LNSVLELLLAGLSFDRIVSALTRLSLGRAGPAFPELSFEEVVSASTKFSFGKRHSVLD